MRDEMEIIAHIHSDFPAKFGIPRQSGLVNTEALVVFEPKYRRDEALRGIDKFSYLWLIWKFSESETDEWSPTVRPPRLGGNKRVGVFATRSPFRPNPIGLSSVKLVALEKCSLGTVLRVSGADLMDGTPIYDIKPYLTFTDSHPDAEIGFAGDVLDHSLCVEFPDEFLSLIPEVKRSALCEILSEDPRPHYISDPSRIYGFCFAGYEIKFRVNGKILTVTEVIKLP